MENIDHGAMAVESTELRTELRFGTVKTDRLDVGPDAQVTRATFRVAKTTSWADSVTESFDSSDSMISAEQYAVEVLHP